MKICKRCGKEALKDHMKQFHAVSEAYSNTAAYEAKTRAELKKEIKKTINFINIASFENPMNMGPEKEKLEALKNELASLGEADSNDDVDAFMANKQAEFADKHFADKDEDSTDMDNFMANKQAEFADKHFSDESYEDFLAQSGEGIEQLNLKETIGEYNVSTVMLPDAYHDMNLGMYETMIQKNGEFIEYQKRYDTEEEARSGHQEAIIAVKENKVGESKAREAVYVDNGDAESAWDGMTQDERDDYIKSNNIDIGFPRSYDLDILESDFAYLPNGVASQFENTWNLANESVADWEAGSRSLDFYDFAEKPSYLQQADRTITNKNFSVNWGSQDRSNDDDLHQYGEPDSSQGDQLKCSHCGQTFNTSDDTEDHLRSAHGITESKATETLESVVQYFTWKILDNFSESDHEMFCIQCENSGQSFEIDIHSQSGIEDGSRHLEQVHDIYDMNQSELDAEDRRRKAGSFPFERTYESKASEDFLGGPSIIGYKCKGCGQVFDDMVEGMNHVEHNHGGKSGGEILYASNFDDGSKAKDRSDPDFFDYYESYAGESGYCNKCGTYSYANSMKSHMQDKHPEVPRKEWKTLEYMGSSVSGDDRYVGDDIAGKYYDNTSEIEGAMGWQRKDDGWSGPSDWKTESRANEEISDSIARWWDSKPLREGGFSEDSYGYKLARKIGIHGIFGRFTWSELPDKEKEEIIQWKMVHANEGLTDNARQSWDSGETTAQDVSDHYYGDDDGVLEYSGKSFDSLPQDVKDSVLGYTEDLTSRLMSMTTPDSLEWNMMNDSISREGKASEDFSSDYQTGMDNALGLKSVSSHYSEDTCKVCREIYYSPNEKREHLRKHYGAYFDQIVASEADWDHLTAEDEVRLDRDIATLETAFYEWHEQDSEKSFRILGELDRLREIKRTRFESDESKASEFGSAIHGSWDQGGFFFGIPNMTRDDYEGTVYWKGKPVEHYDHDYFAEDGFEQEMERDARELARKCEELESRGIKPTTSAILNGESKANEVQSEGFNTPIHGKHGWTFSVIDDARMKGRYEIGIFNDDNDPEYGVNEVKTFLTEEEVFSYIGKFNQDPQGTFLEIGGRKTDEQTRASEYDRYLDEEEISCPECNSLKVHDNKNKDDSRFGDGELECNNCGATFNKLTESKASELTEECPKCSGSGVIDVYSETKGEDLIDCPECDGTGKITKASEVNIERGDSSMTIDGKNVIKIWESTSGWYWYAIEDQGSYTGVGADGEDVQAHAWYGYVQGFENEWGTWDSNELERAGVWTVPQSNWGWTGKESYAKASEAYDKYGNEVIVEGRT